MPLRDEMHGKSGDLGEKSARGERLGMVAIQLSNAEGFRLCPAGFGFILLGVFAGVGLALLGKPSTKRQFGTHLNSADGESVRS
jgi:hypothetical protein